MNWIPKISSTAIDTIDLFCGYGGWSTAAGVLNIWVKRALNHWAHAIDVHHANHPHTSHFLGDVHDTSPSQHPTTAIFMGSPTCTDFTQADPKNVLTLASEGQMRLFKNDQREYERLVAQHQGRATMFDVVKFTDHHRYHYGIIENVVEVHKWSLFERWCRDLANAGGGYNFKFLYLNSMFFHELNGVEDMPIIPQSRDRWYCVFWRKGNPAPDLEFRPLAPCPNCGDVRAIQIWKNPEKKWGKYGLSRGSYYYGCPSCTERHKKGIRQLPVEPYYYAGINAIDWTVPIMRVDDPRRKPPICENTRRRIQAGLDKYGWEPVVLDLQHTNGNSMKYRSALFPLYTQTKTATQAIAIPPILVNLARTHAKHEGQVKNGLSSPLPTQTSTGTQAVLLPSFMVELYGCGDGRPSKSPLNTVTAGGAKSGLLLPPSFFAIHREGTRTRHPVDSLPTLGAGGAQVGFVLPPSFFTHNYSGRLATDALNPLHTQKAHGKANSLVLPFISTYNGCSIFTNGDEVLPTVTTVERHGFTWPKPTVDECYYRTIRSKIKKVGPNGAGHNESEIGRAMGFPIGPDGYKFDGSTDDITKGFGNAITPGVGWWIINRVIQVMANER